MVDPPYRTKNMMPGMIMLWYGSVATIPSGWHLCDGTVGTPDLRTKIIRCAGVGAPNLPGATGGSATHAHAFTGDGHAHGFIPGNFIDNVYPDGDLDHGTGSTPATGTTNSSSSYPPYHVLCYIMKLPIP